jgi:hypothetical protein
MYRKKKLTKKDLEDISTMSYEKQVTLFKTRAMNKYKEADMKLIPTKYKPSDRVFQKQYNTRLRGYNINLLEEQLKGESLRRSSRIKGDTLKNL